MAKEQKPAAEFKANQTLAPLTATPIHDILLDLSRRSHASYVLLAAAQFENALQELLCSRLPNLSNTKRDKLFKGLGPLSHFSTRIEMACAMGDIDEATRQDLDALREIRNEFAHSSKPIHFHLDEARDLLKKFSGYDAKMDPFAFFNRKLDEIWRVLNPRMQHAALVKALRDHKPEQPTSRKKS